MPPRAAGPRFIGSEIFRGSSYGGRHPLAIPRVSTVIDLARALGWLAPGHYLTAPRAKPAALTAFHRPDYLDALRRAEDRQSVTEAERRRYHIGTTANPVFPEIWRRPATAAGGTLLAADLLAGGAGAVFNPAGGTHHGMPARANGFCYLNDPVLGILTLRRAGLRRIAYIDIDAHHCDGVEAALAADPEVLMISVHEERRWPFTGALGDAGAGQVFNLPVPKGFNDTEMRAVLERLILPKVERFAPEAVVLQCGADAVAEDPLSRLALSNNAHWAVVAALAERTPRLMVLGGGGYDPWTVARLWTGVWGVLADHAIPARLPAAAQAVLRALPARGGRTGAPAEPLVTTLRDPPREGPLRAEVAARIARLAGR